MEGVYILKQLNKKVILIGDPAVGKTSLVTRFVQNSFEDKYIASIGVKVSKKPMDLKIQGLDVKLDMMIFDVLGQHDFRRLRRMYVDGADAIIFVCDLSRVDTIESVESFWYPELERIVGKVPMIILGNKIDITDERGEGASLLKTVAGILLLSTYFCSAKTGSGVEEVFAIIGKEVVERHLEKEMPKAPQSPIENLHMAADAIISHFCEHHENRDMAIEICAVVFKQAEFDIKNPTKESLVKAIEILMEKDKDTFDNEMASRNKAERLKFLVQF